MTTLTLTQRRPTLAEKPVATSRREARMPGDSSRDGGHDRRIRILEIIAVIAIGLALLAATIAGSHSQPGPLETTRVFVEKGDTLWSLAQSHPIPGQSTEQTAQMIAQLNALGSAELVEGSVLKLPRTQSEAPMLASR